jgi:hypothetical protein
MRKVLWAALCAAGVMVSAGQAEAAVQFDFSSTSFGGVAVTWLSLDPPSGSGAFPVQTEVGYSCTTGLGTCTGVQASVGPNDIGIIVSYTDLAGVQTGLTDEFFIRGANTGVGIFDTFRGAEGGLLTIAQVPIPPGGIPEPATWALLILGFGGVGGLLRRQKGYDGAAPPAIQAPAGARAGNNAPRPSQPWAVNRLVSAAPAGRASPAA